MIMKKLIRKISKSSLALVFTFASTVPVVSAQGFFNTGVDIVSSYVWRGVAQGSNEPNIQPSASYTICGLSIGAWGSGNLSGSLKEFDIYATYALSSKISVTLTDYNWIFSKGYFDYADGTDHIYEATLAYNGDESLPISASWNTMFAGADKNADGDNAYSTYVELGYPISSNAKIFCGASLFDSPSVYGTSGFDVTNIGLKVTKNIEISDKFSLPVYGIAGFNPSANDAFLVVGITL